MNKKEYLLNYLINVSFLLYFLILIVERTLSVVLTFVNDINIFSNGFDTFVYLLVFISIFGWLIYMSIRCRYSFVALIKKDVQIPFIDLCVASGILLLSGMVHTHYTTGLIQFISYGILIIGILLKVILIKGNNLYKWLSFFYLVAFSMAIPVTYYSLIELHTLFHVLEGVSSIALVLVFTYLLILIFKGKDNLFILWPIVLALVLDIPLIVMRWKEEINYFVLIFISLSFILFAIGYIITNRRNKAHV